MTAPSPSHMDAAPAPFGFDGHYLMRVGIQGQELDSSQRDPVSLVFVVDVSGSMADRGRLEIVKQSMNILLDQLNGDDQVGIVIYTTYACVLAEPTLAVNRDELSALIAKLQPQESTNAEAGLMIGYDMAESLLGQRPNTRVILLSDGVANVGNTGPDRILERIQSAVDDGITLTSVGVGMGNFNDVLLEQLANDGDGNYYYIDTMRQAEQIFINNLVSTLQPIAFEAKIQVEFNPDVVAYYRLIGYENRALEDEEFHDDSVDAGEIGYGHSVTALYEIGFVPDFFAGEEQIATTTIRYEHSETRDITEQSADFAVGDLSDNLDALPVSFRVHAVVAELAEMLRQSRWALNGTYTGLIEYATQPRITPMNLRMWSI